MKLVPLTLSDAGGGQNDPLVRRSPAISHRIILWSQNFLTLSKNIPNTSQSSHFFTILTGVPEIQPRPSRDHDFLGSKITKSIFFNLITVKSPNFISNLNDDCSQLSFEVYNVFVPQKLPISRFLIDFFLSEPWPLRRPPTAAISTSPTSIGYQILAKDLSFLMRLCLLL